jgi:hypothetical protein
VAVTCPSPKNLNRRKNAHGFRRHTKSPYLSKLPSLRLSDLGRSISSRTIGNHDLQPLTLNATLTSRNRSSPTRKDGCGHTDQLRRCPLREVGAGAIYLTSRHMIVIKSVKTHGHRHRVHRSKKDRAKHKGPLLRSRRIAHKKRKE